MTTPAIAPSAQHEPLEIRLARRAPLPPVLLALVVAGTLLALMLSAYAIAGILLILGSPEAGWSLAAQTHAALLAAVLLGYGVGAAKYTSQFASSWSARDVANSRWSGFAGLLVGLIISAITVRDIMAFEPDRSMLNVGEALLNVAYLALFWALGRAGYFAVRSVLRPKSIGAVDLFDLKPLYVHGRDQLRVAMIWFVGAALFVAIMLADPNPGVQIDSVKVFGPILAGYVLLAMMIFLLPLRRIWWSVRTAKENALNALMPELRALQIQTTETQTNAPGREADLLARRAFIVSIPEWPIDAAMTGSFVFYILLPVLTWSGGAIVKRLFDTVFMEKLITVIMSA